MVQQNNQLEEILTNEEKDLMIKQIITSLSLVEDNFYQFWNNLNKQETFLEYQKNLINSIKRLYKNLWEIDEKIGSVFNFSKMDNFIIADLTANNTYFEYLKLKVNILYNQYTHNLELNKDIEKCKEFEISKIEKVKQEFLDQKKFGKFILRGWGEIYKLSIDLIGTLISSDWLDKNMEESELMKNLLDYRLQGSRKLYYKLKDKFEKDISIKYKAETKNEIGRGFSNNSMFPCFLYFKQVPSDKLEFMESIWNILFQEIGINHFPDSYIIDKSENQLITSVVKGKTLTQFHQELSNKILLETKEYGSNVQNECMNLFTCISLIPILYDVNFLVLSLNEKKGKFDKIDLPKADYEKYAKEKIIPLFDENNNLLEEVILEATKNLGEYDENIIHGDLHGGNIIVAGNDIDDINTLFDVSFSQIFNNRTKFIDFESIRFGVIGYDQVTLIENLINLSPNHKDWLIEKFIPNSLRKDLIIFANARYAYFRNKEGKINERNFHLERIRQTMEEEKQPLPQLTSIFLKYLDLNNFNFNRKLKNNPIFLKRSLIPGLYTTKFLLKETFQKTIKDESNETKELFNKLYDIFLEYNFEKHPVFYSGSNPLNF